VNLTQKVAEKIKNFKCPRCCSAEGIPYRYAATSQAQLPATAAPGALAAHPAAPATSAAAAVHPPTASLQAIPATTVSSALGVPQSVTGLLGVPPQWAANMDAMAAGMGVWPPGALAAHAQMLMAQQHQAQQQQQQQQHLQAQQAQAAAAAQQAQAAAGKGTAASKKKSKPGPTARAAAAAAAEAESRNVKRKRTAAIAAHAIVDDDEDGKKVAKRKKPLAVTAAGSSEHSLDATAAALAEANRAAEAAGVVGPMSLAVLQHEHLLSVPLDAPPPRTAALYATLLYENLHVQVTPENSNVLWHLLNGYMTRMFDARLEEEILEAAKLVSSTPLEPGSNAAVERLCSLLVCTLLCALCSGVW
jgi:hypothetical protein